MRSLVACFLLMIPAVASAATYDLVAPGYTFVNSNCSSFSPYVPPQIVVTGFSTDGNYVTTAIAYSSGCTLRVKSGRGPGFIILHECFAVVYDLAGNAVQEVDEGRLTQVQCLPPTYPSPPGPFVNPVNPEITAGTSVSGSVPYYQGWIATP